MYVFIFSLIRKNILYTWLHNQRLESVVTSQETMAESRLFNIHRFVGEDYQLWRRQIEIFMNENGLKKYIDGTTPKPTEEANVPAWEKKDAEAQAFLMRGLELGQLRYMTDCSTAAEMWGRLKSIHAERNDQSVQVLLGHFINAKFNSNSTMVDHVERIVTLARRLKDLQMEQKLALVIAKMLSSLPERYDNIRTARSSIELAKGLRVNKSRR